MTEGSTEESIIRAPGITARKPSSGHRAVWPRKVRSLTGLRGIAASVVVQYHYVEATPQKCSLTAARDCIMWLSGGGHVPRPQRICDGADLRTPIRIDGFDAPAYGDFLLRRFARIYRLYVAIPA